MPETDALPWNFLFRTNLQQARDKKRATRRNGAFSLIDIDALVKSRKTSFFVIPAKAGIQ